MDPLLRTALESATAAAAVHRSYAGRVGVEGAVDKGSSDFVSRVDLEAQAAALGVIRSRHPGHRILAEEDEGTPGGTESIVGQAGPVGGLLDAGGDPEAPIWIVDPLDGTTNFLHGHPFYCSSVAVFDDGRPAAGAVECAPSGERWWAARGRGAYKNGRRIQVSSLPSLTRGLVGTGFPFKAPELLPRYQEQFRRVLRATSGIRRGGSAAMDLCHLAEGIFDGFWELHLFPWDVAAGLLIVREAGGVVSRLDGSEADLAEGSIVAANSTRVHQMLIRAVEGRD